MDASTCGSEDESSDGDQGNNTIPSLPHHPPGGSRLQLQKDSRSPFSSFSFSKFHSSQDSPCGSTASSQSTARFIPVKPTKLACPDETDTFSENYHSSVSEENQSEVDNKIGHSVDSDLSQSQRPSLYSIDTDDVEFSLFETDISSQQSVDSPSLLSVSKSFSRADSQPRPSQDTRKCPSMSSFFATERQGQFRYTPGRVNEKLHSAGDLSAFGSNHSSSNNEKVNN